MCYVPTAWQVLRHKPSQGQLDFLVFITQQNRCHCYPQKKKWLEVVRLTAEPGQGREESGLSCGLTSNATLCSFTTQSGEVAARAPQFLGHWGPFSIPV